MSKERILAGWLERAAAAKLLTPNREVAQSQVDGWLDLLLAETESSAELDRLVAFECRNLGQTGRPASATISSLLALEDSVKDELGKDHPATAHARELVKIAADAHALGHGQRLEASHQKLLSTSTPVLRFKDKAVVGWLMGPILADAIDALLGRVFSSCAGTGAPIAIVDISAAEPPNDLLYRTIEGYAASDVAPKFRLVLTGVPDVDAVRATLNDRGVDTSKVGLHAQLEAFLETL